MTIRDSKLREIEDSLDLSKGSIRDIKAYRRRNALNVKIVTSLELLIGLFSFYAGYAVGFTQERAVDSYPFLMVSLTPKLKKNKRTIIFLIFTIVITILSFFTGFILSGGSFTGIRPADPTRYGVFDSKSSLEI